MDGLPVGVFLEGELFEYGLSRQSIMSTVKKENGLDLEWGKIRFYVFGSPTLYSFFRDRRVEYKPLKIDFKIRYHECLSVLTAWNTDKQFRDGPAMFDASYGWLVEQCHEWDETVVRLLPQMDFTDIAELDGFIEMIRENGGEGVMFRLKSSTWAAQQSRNLLKYKFVDDAEARIVGWEPGKGKYEGMLGALIVEWAGGRSFKLSGMTDELRELGHIRHGEEAEWGPKHFVNNQLVNFTYSGLSMDGIPQEARFNSVVEG